MHHEWALSWLSLSIVCTNLLIKLLFKHERHSILMKGAASFVSTAYRSSADHNHANDPVEKESDCSLRTSARSIRNPCALRVGHAPGHVSVEYEYPRYPWNARRDCQASSRRVGWLNGGHLGATVPKFICKSICFAAEARKYLLCCVIDGRAERRLMDWMAWILKQLTPKHLNIHKYFCRLRRRCGVVRTRGPAIYGWAS